GGPRQSDDGQQPALQEAKDFLRSELASGPKLAKEVAARASTLGITKTTLRRAREALGVKAFPKEFGGDWNWALQSRSSDDERDCVGQDEQDCESPINTG